MPNDLKIEALDDGTMKVSVCSKGERDMSAKVTADELDTLMQRAHNDHARGVYAKQPTGSDPRAVEKAEEKVEEKPEPEDKPKKKW